MDIFITLIVVIMDTTTGDIHVSTYLIVYIKICATICMLITPQKSHKNK